HQRVTPSPPPPTQESLVLLAYARSRTTLTSCAANMTYPGNQSLASDVQQRIRSTFEHTLGLAEKGSHQEALLGCDFVLRMDPLFEPARRLQERLESTPGPLAVDDLRHFDAASPFQAPLPAPPSAAATAASSRPPGVAAPGVAGPGAPRGGPLRQQVPALREGGPARRAPRRRQPAGR